MTFLAMFLIEAIDFPLRVLVAILFSHIFIKRGKYDLYRRAICIERIECLALELKK